MNRHLRSLRPLGGLFFRMYAGILVAIVLAVALMLELSSRRMPPQSLDAEHAETHADSSGRELEGLTQGLQWLIEKELLAQPQERWADVVAGWRPHFDYPIELRPRSEVLAMNLPARVRERLTGALPSAWLHSSGVAGDRVLLFLPLRGSEQLVVQSLRLGPSPQRVVEFLALETSVLLVVLGLALLALTWPLYRHVTRLAATARAFGQGDFQARAEARAPEPIGHMARTFNDLAERIQRMSQEQQASLQAISHELRTPLSRLHFALYLARETADVESMRTQLVDMEKDVGELEQLTEELLTYTRLHHDAPPLEWERVDLPGMVTELFRQLSVFSPDLRLRLEAEGLVDAEGSARYLRRAIGNLIRNAQRYARSELQVRVSQDAAGFTVSVDDDGPGVPPAERERLFLPFTRLDDSRDRKTGGHGLGLAIVHRVMQAHQGHAQVTQAPLGGARVTLSWPRSPVGAVTNGDNR
ncbi:sensor histidine kinase [Myxococcus stipitatus DSM 14675]|uniref:histidine kinase n=1 Tax=Myxococcus stipitatus (strain DSM 14675 / JCM 12634 / Mx s8) TaxID=1278073 RepID=L7U3V5_MYXSD|nr:ATP-binding protein [Myxococcus stipitatus]AGC43426.1 sensor histidine kinase [Myxococcus stipitatus DSM 14675]